MSERKQVLLNKCNQLLTELDKLFNEAKEEIDDYDPNDWWSQLFSIVDKVDNLQQGEKLPEKVWMETELPSEEDDNNVDFEWFKIDVQHVERGISRIIDWIENYLKKEEEKKEKEERKEKEKKRTEVKKPEVEEKEKELKEKKIGLSIGPFTIPITKEQAIYAGLGFALGFITAILAVVLPIVL